MLIDTAYRKYSGPMLQAMIRFSRDETAANDAVSQAFTQALVNRAMLEAMPEPAMKAWLYATAAQRLNRYETQRGTHRLRGGTVWR